MPKFMILCSSSLTYHLVVEAPTRVAAESFYESCGGEEFHLGEEVGWDLDDIYQLDEKVDGTHKPSFVVDETGEVIEDLTLKETPQEPPQRLLGTTDGFVDLGDAMELCLRMAKRLFKNHGEVCGARNLAVVDEAFKVVEDFIVNHLGEEE